MTNQAFIVKYENVLRRFFDKGGWETQKIGDYVDSLYECKSDFYGIFANHWTRDDEIRLSRLMDDCELQPIYGIRQFINWMKNK